MLWREPSHACQFFLLICGEKSSLDASKWQPNLLSDVLYCSPKSVCALLGVVNIIIQKWCGCYWYLNGATSFFKSQRVCYVEIPMTACWSSPFVRGCVSIVASWWRLSKCNLLLLCFKKISPYPHATYCHFFLSQWWTRFLIENDFIY